MDSEQLLARVDRLERANRRLTRSLIGLGGLIVFATAVGFQQTPDVMDVLRVRKLEVVDARGVPMVTLDSGRRAEGGAITLRDSLGERRGWWTTSPDGSNLAMSHVDPQTEKGSTAGMSASPNSAEMNLIGPDGAMLNSGARQGTPKIELWNSKGEVVFTAPWDKN